MSGFKVEFSVLNQLATPAMYAAALANRPAAGQPGRIFIDTDNPSTGIYRDTGITWVQVASTSTPEADTLQTVTDRGNTTTRDVAIGTSTSPTAPLEVWGDGVIQILRATDSHDSFLQFNKSGSGKFKVGNVHNSGNDYFTVYNLQENSNAILVNISTNNVAIGGHTVTPTYQLDVAGSFRNGGNAYLATAGGNKVGINTVTPAYTLDVVGDIRATNITAAATFTGQDYLYAGALRIHGTGGTGTVSLWTNSNTRLHITNGGNVIINNGTTDAGFKLDINGSFISRGTANVGGSANVVTLRGTNAQSGYGITLNGDTWITNSLDVNGRVSAGGSTHSSAIMSATSVSQGFLPPRMTGLQAEAIATPAAGLLVYANNGNGVTITTTGWWGYDGAAWVKLN